MPKRRTRKRRKSRKQYGKGSAMKKAAVGALAVAGTVGSALAVSQEAKDVARRIQHERLSGNCKFNRRFEFKEEIDKNVKIFVIKN